MDKNVRKISNLDSLGCKHLAKKDIDIIKSDLNIFGNILSDSSIGIPLNVSIELKDSKNRIKKVLYSENLGDDNKIEGGVY